MEYFFTNKQTGEKIKATLEKWSWGVVYNDDTEFFQFNPDGSFHQFAEIDQARVRMFVMYKTDDMSKRIDIAVNEDMQIFHFYRNFILNQGTEAESRPRAYCFGWKDRKTGATSYHFILPDDRIVIGNGDLNLMNFKV